MIFRPLHQPTPWGTRVLGHVFRNPTVSWRRAPDNCSKIVCSSRHEPHKATNNKVSIEPNVPISPSSVMPKFKKKDDATASFLTEQRIQEDELQARETEKRHAANITTEQKAEQLAILHKLMDNKIMYQGQAWSKLLEQGSTEEDMLLFSQCIEDATGAYATLSPKEQSKVVGRSTVNIVDRHDLPPATYNGDTQEMETPLRGEVERLLTQYRRLIKVRNCAIKKLDQPCR